MKRMAWRTVLPAFLAIALFSGVVFLYLLPSLDRVVMDQKRLMIRELTESAWNVLASFENEVQSGNISRAEARQAAIQQVRNLHYGQENKDYFFIIDMHPHMVVHPHRPELEGTDLSNFGDPHGKLLFSEMVDVVKRDGAGYVSYMWQWKDDSNRIVPKISYVKGFVAWDWVIGTGVYTEDVDAEITSLKDNLHTAIMIILLLVSLLLVLLLRASFQAERGRLQLTTALGNSEEKYRSLVESAGEAIMMSIAGEGLYANASLLHLLGYKREEFEALEVNAIISPTAEESRHGQRHWLAIVAGTEAPTRYETELICSDGSHLRVFLSLSRIVVQGRIGFMAVAARVAKPRELDILTAEDLEDLEAACRRTGDLANLMLAHGADGMQVSRLLSVEADAVVRKAVEFIVDELGEVPVPFDIMLMGSFGRGEVTFSADQDHAIIYADVEPEQEDRVKKYFLSLGTRLSNLLNAAGYPYCDGKIMASEPDCCQSLNSWKKTFDGWITTLEPNDLLKAKIFFDFRSVLDEGELVTTLRGHLAETLKENPRFFPMLAQSILYYEPPLNTFGSFVLEKHDDGFSGIDIKGVMAQVADMARLRALQWGIDAVGTLDRLLCLAQAGHFQQHTADDLAASFQLMANLRMKHQARLRSDKMSPDNFLDPENFTDEDRRGIKHAFRLIKALQDSLQHEFGTRL